MSGQSNNGDGGAIKRKRNKSYYSSFQRAPKEGRLEAGCVGVLVTSDTMRQREAKAEALEILDRCADQLYPRLQATAATDSSEVSISDALEREIRELQSKALDSSSPGRFKALSVGRTHGMTFLQCMPPVDPADVVLTLLTDMKKTGQQQSRFVQRMIPVQATCKAHSEDIAKAAKDVVDRHLATVAQPPVKFAVVYKSRNNGSLDRMETIKGIADAITEGRTLSVDLTNPDMVVVVEVIGNRCCLCVAKDFYQLKRYNVQELVTAAQIGAPANANDKTHDLETS